MMEIPSLLIKGWKWVEMESSCLNVFTDLFVQWCNELAYAHIILVTMWHMLIDWCSAGEPCWSFIAHNVEEVERFFKETIENRSAKSRFGYLKQ